MLNVLFLTGSEEEGGGTEVTSVTQASSPNLEQLCKEVSVSSKQFTLTKSLTYSRKESIKVLLYKRL